MSYRPLRHRAENEAARELMERNDVPIDDLHAQVGPDMARFLGGDQIHLSEAGEKACARVAVETVTVYL